MDKTIVKLRGRVLKNSIASAALVLVCGCASSIRYSDVDSRPSGATIFINGEKVGVTRAEKAKLDFSSNTEGRVLIQLVKPRYRPVLQYWRLEEVPQSKVFTLEVD